MPQDSTKTDEQTRRIEFTMPPDDCPECRWPIDDCICDDPAYEDDDITVCGCCGYAGCDGQCVRAIHLSKKQGAE